MIPDYPIEKEKLMQIWMHFFEVKHNEHLGIFGQTPKFMNYEGDQWMLYRTDGTSEDNPYHDLRQEFSISFEEAPTLTPEKIAKKLDEFAKKMASQTVKGILADISRATEKVGNTVYANGQPLSKELFLQVIEKIEMDFDKEGKPIYPSILISPELLEANKDEIQSWEEDLEFKAKFDEQIESKKVRWYARENSRKLVD